MYRTIAQSNITLYNKVIPNPIHIGKLPIFSSIKQKAHLENILLYIQILTVLQTYFFQHKYKYEKQKQ